MPLMPGMPAPGGAPGMGAPPGVGMPAPMGPPGTPPMGAMGAPAGPPSPMAGAQPAQMMAMLAGMGLQEFLRTMSKFLKTTTAVGGRGDSTRMNPMAGRMGPADGMARMGLPPQAAPAMPMMAAGVNPMMRMLGGGM